MGVGKSRVWIATAALAIASVVAPSFAGDTAVEYAVKGAYLYKMLPFVDWPQSVFQAPNSPIAICLIGPDPFGSGLDKAVADQRVGAHPVVVRRDTQSGDTSCEVVFIALTDPQQESDVLHAFEGRPVLTVTDSGAPAPGIVAFVVEKNHVRFDIDDAAAAKDGLSISSKLLDLARTVKPRKVAP